LPLAAEYFFAHEGKMKMVYLVMIPFVEFKILDRKTKNPAGLRASRVHKAVMISISS
jgi:hypothetical protein